MTTDEKLDTLIKEGNTFNYNNFSTKGQYGYPDAEDPKYTSWKLKAETFLVYLFGNDSIMHQNYKRHLNFHVIGNGGDQFYSQINQILGTLQAAKETINYVNDSATLGLSIENLSNDVFVVHGHDEILKTQAEIFLKEVGLNPIVLHRQADEGLTIIEKFEKHSQVRYAFILMSPDDIVYSATDEILPDDQRKKEFVARPNVIFEFGYFIGKLGRNRVCCIFKNNVKEPTDLSGLIYKKIHKDIEEAAFSIIKDLKSAGFKLSL